MTCEWFIRAQSRHQKTAEKAVQVAVQGLQLRLLEPAASLCRWLLATTARNTAPDFSARLSEWLVCS